MIKPVPSYQRKFFAPGQTPARKACLGQSSQTFELPTFQVKSREIGYLLLRESDSNANNEGHDRKKRDSSSIDPFFGMMGTLWQKPKPTQIIETFIALEK